MTSERRQKANQRNAQKSTGPKTPEGKARTRQNALKHGLTGEGTVLPPEDIALFEERLEDWMADADPDDPMEAYVVRLAVLSSVRIDRCARQEFAVIAKRRRESIYGWQCRQAKGIGKLIERLEEAPGAVVEVLQESARGCDWLVEQWQELLGIVEREEAWTACQSTRALRLLGIDPAAEVDNDRALAVRREVAAGEPGHGADRERLQAIISEEIARLRPLAESLWNAQDGPSLAEAIDLGGFDGSPEGVLRLRYETASMRVFHRSVDQLLKMRKGRPVADREASDMETLPNEPIAPGDEVKHECTEGCGQPCGVERAPVAQVQAPAETVAVAPMPEAEPVTEAPAPNEPQPEPQILGTAEPGNIDASASEPPAPPRKLSELELWELSRKIGGWT